MAQLPDAEAAVLHDASVGREGGEGVEEGTVEAREDGGVVLKQQ